MSSFFEAFIDEIEKLGMKFRKQWKKHMTPEQKRRVVQHVSKSTPHEWTYRMSEPGFYSTQARLRKEAPTSMGGRPGGQGVPHESPVVVGKPTSSGGKEIHLRAAASEAQIRRGEPERALRSVMQKQSLR